MPSEAPEAGASSLPPPGAGARGEALSAAADRSEGLTSSPATIGVHQPWVEMLTLLVHWGMSIVHKRSGWIHSCAASALCATSALRAASGSTGSNLVLHLVLWCSFCLHGGVYIAQGSLLSSTNSIHKCTPLAFTQGHAPL
eukprot:scaffold214865_cov24-Tisochrysis_lutea.AAC.3